LRRIEICKKAVSPFQRLCASRSGEVLGARWSEIDIDQKAWTVPAARMKANSANPPAALKILAAQSHDSEFVFAAPRSGGALERHALADEGDGAS
jgi:integrase